MPSNQLLVARVFALPRSDQQLVLSAPVLATFLRFRQTGSLPEAGGLLFAEFQLPVITVVEASTPSRADRRSRNLFIPNRHLQRRKIQKQFRIKKHFVGEWHTHPEPRPAPSRLDLESMADSFCKSYHELNYFIMIITGNELSGLSLWVSAHDGNRIHTLPEITESPA